MRKGSEEMTVESGVLAVLQEYWHVILAGISFVVGYTKLNSKVEQNARDNEATKAEWRATVQALEKRVGEQRREDMDRVENVMSEVRADIKTLLQRH